ncbi:MAG: TlpA disulfide reductase family protein [Myxococcota bacterium]|nr:TlpA disulfide reductase family protein [Myxococcota bacterium]
MKCRQNIVPWLLLVGLFTVLAGAGCPGGARIVVPAADRPQPELGEPLRRLDGTSTTLASYRGQILLVNFFATDCIPCLDEVPDLLSLQRELGERGLQVVGISLDLQGALTVELFRERYGIGYPLLLASEPMFRRETPFGTLPGLPMTVLLDRRGRTAGWVLGRFDLARTRRAILELLAEQ